MARTWTDAQLSAINTNDRTLLVSAAAGSGKTATLTEKIIRALTDKDSPAELSRMLIVTFTKAAAAELKERISSALTEAIASAPSNRHLYRQLLSLPNADICTIDSFYLKPIREHFAECGLPSSFRIADQAELGPLCERVMSEIIDEFFIRYAKATDKEGIFDVLTGNDFADLCDSITPAKSDGDLIGTLLSLYEKLLSYPEGFERLKSEAADLRANASKDFFASRHGAILRRRLEELCASATDFYTYAIDYMSDDAKAIEKYMPAFVSDMDFYKRLKLSLNTDGTYVSAREQMIAYNFPGLDSYTKAPEEIVRIKAGRDALKADTVDLKNEFFPPDEEGKAPFTDRIAEEMRLTARMCELLYELLTEYDKRISEEKKSRGICDFTDNRRMLLSLLLDGDGNPSELAREYQAKYDRVYIDEYQDVDEVQDKIFSLIGADHRFMVGDIKQSIYGFRGAEPSVFARYRKTLPSLDSGKDASLGSSIFMSENFRCNKPVIKTTNAVCGHIFRSCPDGIGYTELDDLVFSKLLPDTAVSQPKVEIDVIVPESKKRTKTADDAPKRSNSELPTEAIHIANRIAELLNSDARLADGRRITPSDIAILVRGNTPLAELRRALTEMNIPAGCDEMDAVAAGRDILHGPDMMYLVNLLRVINNPDSDIPLSELLRLGTPQGDGLTLEELVRLRHRAFSTKGGNADKHSLWQTALDYVEKERDGELAVKCADFISWIEKYRSLATTLSAHELISLLRRDGKCYCRYSRAFLYLYESARTYRSSSFTSLYTFLAYFERLLITAKNLKTPPSDGGGEVSIMTMHNSKGLEFPVCFLYKCGQTFSSKSLVPDLLFESESGLSLKLFTRVEAGGYKRDTILRAVGKLGIKMREREEEMRVLYVAMTRAREYLYVCGTGSVSIESFSGFRTGDRFLTLNASNYLQWIISGINATAGIEEYCNVSYIHEEDITKGDTLSRKSASEPQDTNTDTDSDAEYYRALHQSAPVMSDGEKLLRILPTKAPASRLAPNMLDKYVFYDNALATSQTTADNEETQESDVTPTSVDSRLDFEAKEAVRERIRIMSSSSEDGGFDALISANQRPTAADRGTAAHAFLQFCDFERFRSCADSASIAKAVEEELERLLHLGFIDQRGADIVDRAYLNAFFASELFGRILNSKYIERELKFNRFLPLSSLTSNEALSDVLGDRTLYVQGSVDLVIHNKDGSIELCDYKTDRISAEERADRSLLAASMKNKHGAQLAQYAEAIFDLYHEYPRSISIYSFPLGEAVKIDMKLG